MGTKPFMCLWQIEILMHFSISLTHCLYMMQHYALTIDIRMCHHYIYMLYVENITLNKGSKGAFMHMSISYSDCTFAPCNKGRRRPFEILAALRSRWEWHPKSSPSVHCCPQAALLPSLQSAHVRHASLLAMQKKCHCSTQAALVTSLQSKHMRKQLHDIIWNEINMKLTFWRGQTSCTSCHNKVTESTHAEQYRNKYNISTQHHNMAANATLWIHWHQPAHPHSHIHCSAEILVFVAP